MPQMGKPINMKARAFQNVQMAPRTSQKPQNINELPEKERERLLSRLTGYKKKNDLYVDGKKHNKMGKDEFLRLMTVQLKNQDPMDPMKQDKIAGELAQFSQLEQLSNLNTKFDTLTQNKNVEDKFYGASFLGKEVVTSGSSLKFEGEGTESDILFALPKPASKVVVRIFDSKNNMVGEIWKENIGRGNQTFTWDGMQLDNSFSGPGEFKTQVYAWDQFADPIDVETKSIGRVESVFFENGETVLKVDGKKVFLRDVDSFHVPGTSKNDQAKAGAPSQAAPDLSKLRNLNNSLQQVRANNAATNLPVAENNQTKVNLNKLKGLNSYKQNQVPTTGVTSVYDD